MKTAHLLEESPEGLSFCGQTEEPEKENTPQGCPQAVELCPT